MRRIQALALACLFATPMAFAQNASPARMALAQKLFDLQQASSVFQTLEFNVIGGFMNQVGQNLGDKASCPALQPEAKAFRAKMDTAFNAMNDATFKQAALKVYTDTFTDDEMRQIIAFMQSPAGMKLTQSASDVAQKIMKAANDRAQPHEAEIKAQMSAFNDKVTKIASMCTPMAAPPKK